MRLVSTRGIRYVLDHAKEKLAEPNEEEVVLMRDLVEKAGG